MSLYDSLIESVIYEDSIEEYNIRKILDNLFSENFEISADQIKYFSESFNLLESSDILFEASNELSKLCTNSKGIETAIDKTGKEIGNIIKSEGITKSSKSKIADAVDKFKKQVTDFNDKEILGIKLSDADKAKLAKFDSKNVQRAMVLVFECVVVNTLCAIILSTIFGPQLGQVLLAVIVAPITEETSKAISIKNNYGTEFFTIFNMYEASSYILRMTIVGIPFKNALRGRLLAAGMHLSTTIVQWMMNNSKFLNKLGINEKDEEAKKKASFIGQVIGSIIHFCWNLAASLSPNFNNAILGMKIF